MSKAKKSKVDKPREPEQEESKVLEENEVQENPVQEDHTYGKKSDGGEVVVVAESQFLRSLHEAAGRLLADPAGNFDHPDDHPDDQGWRPRIHQVPLRPLNLPQ